MRHVARALYPQKTQCPEQQEVPQQEVPWQLVWENCGHPLRQEQKVALRAASARSPSKTQDPGLLRRWRSCGDIRKSTSRTNTFATRAAKPASPSVCSVVLETVSTEHHQLESQIVRRNICLRRHLPELSPHLPLHRAMRCFHMVRLGDSAPHDIGSDRVSNGCVTSVRVRAHLSTVSGQMHVGPMKHGIGPTAAPVWVTALLKLWRFHV